MIDLERKLLLGGFRRNSDGSDIPELDEDTWLSADEQMDSLVVSVIHWCIDAARRAEKGQDTPAVHALFDLKLKGIKYLKLDYGAQAPDT